MLACMFRELYIGDYITAAGGNSPSPNIQSTYTVRPEFEPRHCFDFVAIGAIMPD